MRSNNLSILPIEQYVEKFNTKELVESFNYNNISDYEKLINNDSENTNLDYYELSAKISQNIYDFGHSTSKYKSAKNKIEIARAGTT